VEAADLDVAAADDDDAAVDDGMDEDDALRGVS
jgi:hypothetical protein